MSVNSWLTDINKIPQYKNRLLYGYATLNIGQIRLIKLFADDYPIFFDTIDCSNADSKSHAGIIVQINGTTITGGHNPIFETLELNEPEDYIMMAIQAELLKIASPNLVRF